jgi:hypothetical protein
MGCIYMASAPKVFAASGAGTPLVNALPASQFTIDPIKERLPMGAMTLVAAIRYGCPHCENAVPFYRQSRLLESKHYIRVHLVFVAPDDSKTIQNLLGSVSADRIIPGIPLALLGVTGTPYTVDD